MSQSGVLAACVSTVDASAAERLGGGESRFDELGVENRGSDGGCRWSIGGLLAPCETAGLFARGAMALGWSGGKVWVERLGDVWMGSEGSGAGSLGAPILAVGLASRIVDGGGADGSSGGKAKVIWESDAGRLRQTPVEGIDPTVDCQPSSSAGVADATVSFGAAGG